jgi:hypothetical protein
MTKLALQLLADISNPHMKALNDDITAEYPDFPDEAFTGAFALQLGVLLASLSDDNRPHAVKLINDFLANAGVGYRLTGVQ